MKLIIDVPEEVYDALKGIAEDTTSLDPYSLADIIVNRSKSLDDIRPKGEWSFCEGVTTQGSLKCSNCKWLDFHKAYSNYCPNCGADMRSGFLCQDSHT